MNIIFDIETNKNPLADSIVSQMKIKPLSTLKPDKKIKDDEERKLDFDFRLAESITKKRNDAVDKAALHWWTGMVIQISASSLDGLECYSENINTIGGEKTLIESFFHWLYIVEATELLGKNAHTFDKPFLTGRAMFHEVKVANLIRPYRVTDMDDIFGKGYSSQTTTLDNYALGLGLDAKLLDSALIPEMAERGEWDKIQAHCDQDLMITREIFRRFLK